MGSEPAFLTPLPRLRSLPSLRSRIPKTQILRLFTVLLNSRGPQIGPITQWDPHMDPLGPKVLQMDPKGIPRWPKGLQMTVKWAPQKGTNGNKRETNVSPKASQWDPRGGQREPWRAQPYEQTPDQPPKRPLCYCWSLTIRSDRRITYSMSF